VVELATRVSENDIEGDAMLDRGWKKMWEKRPKALKVFLFFRVLQTGAAP
jgi:hypothetical protein